MALCPNCGNDVLDPTKCAICKDGRGAAAMKKRRQAQRKASSQCPCPRCNEALVTQDWEGVATLSCASCQGTFFPGQSLEQVLDKLRATVDPMDAQAVLKEFKDRFSRQLPDAIRYKSCPVCEGVMTRRGYGTVSGVIVDVCTDHGTWVDQTQFAELANFICRGGDILAERASRVRDRIGRRKEMGRTVLDRFLGN